MHVLKNEESISFTGNIKNCYFTNYYYYPLYNDFRKICKMTVTSQKFIIIIIIILLLLSLILSLIIIFIIVITTQYAEFESFDIRKLNYSVLVLGLQGHNFMFHLVDPLSKIYYPFLM